MLRIAIIAALAFAAPAIATPPPNLSIYHGERYAYGVGFRYGQSNALAQLAAWNHTPVIAKSVCTVHANRWVGRKANRLWDFQGCLDGVAARKR